VARTLVEIDTVVAMALTSSSPRPPATSATDRTVARRPDDNEDGDGFIDASLRPAGSRPRVTV
jgi:hypothetical protein